MKGLDEEFVIVIKQRKLNWPTMHTNKLAVLADQLPKVIQKKEKGEAAKITNLQLQQLSDQGRPSQRTFNKLAVSCLESSLFRLQF